MALMYNTRQVPAEWQVKPTTDHGDWRFFKCEPEQGLLPPGQKKLLKVQLHTYTTVQTRLIYLMSAVITVKGAAAACTFHVNGTSHTAMRIPSTLLGSPHVSTYHSASAMKHMKLCSQ